MRIGIDGRALQGKRAGIGRYVYQLCRELDRILPNAQFFVYSHVPVEMPLSSERWILRMDYFPFAKYMKSVLWLKLRCGIICAQDNLDVFWASATFLPKLHRSVKKVVTVYDLNYKVVPKTMGMTHRWAYKLFFEKDIRCADNILVISKGTANRLYEITGRKASAVVRPSVEKSFRPVNNGEIRQCMNIYGIQDPYILAVATWEPRKNVRLLVKTFMSMKNEGILPLHKLYLIGGRGWKDRRLSVIVKENKGHDVIPLGYVPEEHLAPIYGGADVFVFPSIYEGFGMPVLEARICGTKVVASNIPELREAGGTDAIYITPTAEGICNGILAALSEAPKGKMIEFDFPSWEDGAKTLATALKGKFS